MTDYQKMYYTLFHATEDAISLLGTPPCSEQEVPVRNKAIHLLIAAQQACEDIYIDSEA